MKTLKRISQWLMRDAQWWQFWHPSSGISGGAVMGLLIVVVVFALSGCTVVPAGSAYRACDLLQMP